MSSHSTSQFINVENAGTIKRDQEHLGLLAVFHYVVGAFLALISLFPLIHVTVGISMVADGGLFSQTQSSAPPEALFGWFFVVIGLMAILFGEVLAACIIISGRLISLRKRRMFSIVIAALVCTSPPFGTVLGVFTILVLSRESVRNLYAEHKQV